MKTVLFTWLASLAVLLVNAQKNANVNYELRPASRWYEQPYIWVAAACLFLYLMVLIIKKSERN